jgi:hypothetical protein
MSKRRAVQRRRKFMIASAAAIIYFHVGAFCVGHAERQPPHHGEMASSLSLYAHGADDDAGGADINQKTNF